MHIYQPPVPIPDSNPNGQAGFLDAGGQLIADDYVEPPTPESYPHWTEIDTPWERTPIAWRYSDFRERDAAYDHLVNIPTNTHLVREALVDRLPLSSRAFSTEPAQTVPEAEDAIAEAEKQFSFLRDNQIRIPDLKWHIFTPAQHTVKVLARVAIIDRAPWPDGAYLRLLRSVRIYGSGHGLRVGEFEQPEQYLYGTPRDKGFDDPAQHLVDIDPATWNVKR